MRERLDDVVQKALRDMQTSQSHDTILQDTNHVIEDSYLVGMAARVAFDDGYLNGVLTADQKSQTTGSSSSTSANWLAFGACILMSAPLAYTVGATICNAVNKYFAYCTALAHHQAYMERVQATRDAKQIHYTPESATISSQGSTTADESEAGDGIHTTEEDMGRTESQLKAVKEWSAAKRR